MLKKLTCEARTAMENGNVTVELRGGCYCVCVPVRDLGTVRSLGAIGVPGMPIAYIRERLAELAARY